MEDRKTSLIHNGRPLTEREVLNALALVEELNKMPVNMALRKVGEDNWACGKLREQTPDGYGDTPLEALLTAQWTKISDVILASKRSSRTRYAKERK